VHLVFKISNLCGPDPPTSQTDGQTDDMQSKYCALHCSASRRKKEEEEEEQNKQQFLYDTA